MSCPLQCGSAPAGSCLCLLYGGSPSHTWAPSFMAGCRGNAEVFEQSSEGLRTGLSSHLCFQICTGRRREKNGRHCSCSAYGGGQREGSLKGTWRMFFPLSCQYFFPTLPSLLLLLPPLSFSLCPLSLFFSLFLNKELDYILHTLRNV